MADLIIKRKITVRSVYGTIPRPAEGDKPVDILQVYGVANGVQIGEDRYRPGEYWTALLGQFEAVNLETGETFTAPRCFLPEPMQGLIVNQLKDGKTESVQFAVVIGYKFAKTSVGYEYTCKPLVKPTGADLLSDLRSALPAPKKASK